MDWHLESSVLLILTTVIFIKPICSIKVCTCSQYVVLSLSPPPPPLSGLHKQCQKGHKEYITRLSETYSFGPSWMHILWRKAKMTDGKKKSSLRNLTRKTEIICWQNGMNTYKQKNLQPNFQTDWMMSQVLTVNHPTLKQKALMNILVTELIAVNYKLCSHCGPTKEDIPTLQSDVITKVRRTPLCVIHPWQPTLTDDLPW